MATRLIDQWLADQGFIVVSLDNRGTPGRGRDWEKAVREKFGSVPAGRPGGRAEGAGPASSPRWTWSASASTAGRSAATWRRWRCCASRTCSRRPSPGRPVVDWLDYDTHYTERYLGLPDKHAEAYREASLLTYANDLRRPLLLIHGTADDNVYFRHTLKLANALFREGQGLRVAAAAGADAHGARPGGDAADVRQVRRLLPAASAGRGVTGQASISFQAEGPETRRYRAGMWRG